MANETVEVREAPRDEVDPAYRQWLVAAEQKAQEDFDKTVLTLSGGALGVSFAFVKDIIGPDAIRDSVLLIVAWGAWALSVSAILASFLLSRYALRRAIEQCDDGTIFCQPPGGFYSKVTRYLNIAGAALFFCGVCFMTAFVSSNLSKRDIQNEREKTTQPAAAAAASLSRAEASPRRHA